MYDGIQEDWINEVIDLSFYTDKPQVWLRFLLKSDGAVEEDGFYFDNFLIHGYSRFMKGDINQDNIINVQDIILAINFILELFIPSDEEFTLCDLNDDGLINILDIVLIVDIIFES